MADTTCFFWIKFFGFWLAMSGLSSLFILGFCGGFSYTAGGCITISTILAGIICLPILFANQIYFGVINKQHSGKSVKKELDTNWLKENYDDVQSQYMNHYVAIYHKEIIDSDTDLNTLKERLKGLQINPLAISIEFVGPK